MAESAGEPPSWPPIRPVARNGPPRDRRKPLRPRQIILAVLAALGVGALLSSGALVGLAERQPLGTQRNVALGAANVADRVAHALSLNRPAAELAAAFEDEQEVYDVEALIARARAAAPPTPAPEPPAEREEERVLEVDEDETTDAAPEESDRSESELGSPTDGVIAPIIGIDCVPIEEDEPQPNGDGDSDDGDSGDGDSDDGDTGFDPSDDSEAPLEPGGSNAEPEPVEDTGDDTSTTTETTDGSDPHTESDTSTPTETTGGSAHDDPNGDSGGATTEDGPGPTDDGTGSSNPGECPPGYVPAGTTDPPATAEPPAETAGPGQDAEDEADDPGGEEDAAVEITFDAPRTPDDESPLKMYVGGDSISRDLGEGLARVTPADVVRIDLDPRPATGLSRPDFFDWSQHLAGVLTESSPDVIVVLFGANDFQDVEYEGEILDRFEGPWLDLYRARVALIMTLLSQPDTQTIWVGQPPVRESRLSGGLAMLNEVYAEQSAEHPQVTYVDTWEVFSDDDGGYVDEIDGVRLRREDGVHLTIAGGNRLAAAVWSAIAPAWGLE